MYVLIALGILVVASFVVAYYASKTWHWSQVVLVLAIFLSAVGYLVLAVETLGIHAIMRSQVNQLTQQLTETQERIAALAGGTDDPQVVSQLRNSGVELPEDAESVSSVPDLDHNLHMLTRIRGPVWRDVKPAGIDPQTGVVHATLASPDAGIDDDTVVFVFEQGEPTASDASKGAEFLGEFRVTEVADQDVTLSPFGKMDELELQRLADSVAEGLEENGTRWAMYASMPVDRHEIFAVMTDEELRKKLPPETVDEYIRNGKEAGPDDDPSERAGYDEAGNRLGPDQMDQAARVVYERRLRDYAVEFEELARGRVVMLADSAAVRQDNERLQESLASAQRLQAFRQDELRRLGIDLAGVTKDREAIETQLALIERQRDVAQQRLADLLQDNSRLASELAAKQAALTERINQHPSEPRERLPAESAL